MAKLKGTVWVDAPVGKVEALGTDVSRWPEWVPGLDRVQVDNGFPQVGTYAEVYLRAAAVRMHMKLQVEEWVPGRRSRFALGGSLINGVNTWCFDEVDGGTEVICEMVYEIPGGPVGEQFYRRAVQPVLVRMMEQILENMAEQAERVA